jgi:hypothetical protein
MDNLPADGRLTHPTAKPPQARGHPADKLI